jgi:predicted SnoaL-like aldol condensation-catalyzing enzyme
MSVEQNEDVVRRIWEEIFNEGRVDLIDELYDANYVYHGPGDQELKGLEGLGEYKRLLRTLIPDVHFSLVDVIADGDKVVARWTMTGTYEPKGFPVTNTGIIISRMLNGKCVEDWEVFDRFWIAEQGATGWLQKRVFNTIKNAMMMALPFLALRQ